MGGYFFRFGSEAFLDDLQKKDAWSGRLSSGEIGILFQVKAGEKKDHQLSCKELYSFWQVTIWMEWRAFTMSSELLDSSNLTIRVGFSATLISPT